MNKLLKSEAYVLILYALILKDVSAKSIQSSPLKIVNGTDAEDGEFPYIVQLFTGSIFQCGGSIISDKWILTAGHCVSPLIITSILYGTNIREEGPSVAVKHSYRHPKFYHNQTIVGGIPLYDIAIVELEEPLKYSEKVQPIQLPDSDEEVPFHTDGVLCGWGSNDTYAFEEINLQKITLELSNDLECTQKSIEFSHGDDHFNSVHNLCNEEHHDGECYGDSGSPYVINGKQYGIASWSMKPCGSSIGAFTRISNPEYREFVRNITGI